MLSDAELREIALAHFRSIGFDDWREWTVELQIIGDPPGAWPVRRHVRGVPFVGPTVPFFIDRSDGLITNVNPEATKALLEWVKAGVPGAREFGAAEGGIDSPIQRAFTRHVLRGSRHPRYANMHAPSLEELLA